MCRLSSNFSVTDDPVSYSSSIPSPISEMTVTKPRPTQNQMRKGLRVGLKIDTMPEPSTITILFKTVPEAFLFQIWHRSF